MFVGEIWLEDPVLAIEEVPVVVLDPTSEEVDEVVGPPFPVVVLLMMPLVVDEVTVRNVVLSVGNKVGKVTEIDTEIEIRGEDEALVEETTSDVPVEEVCPDVVFSIPELVPDD